MTETNIYLLQNVRIFCIPYNFLSLGAKTFDLMKMNRIKEVLQEKMLTQVWLAEKLGKSFKMVNAYACNRKQPSLEILNQIAEILQVSIKDLVVDKNEI